MKSAAIVTKVAGRAYVIRNGEEITLESGSEIFVTDSVRTDADSKLEMRFHDNSEMDLSALSQVNIADFAFDEAGVPPSFGVHVIQGLTRTASGKIVEQNPDGFILSTPLGSAGIRGTVIWASVTDKQVVFTVSEMGEGHTVIISSADGRNVVIHVPETGVTITEGDSAPLDIFNMTGDQIQEYLKGIFQEDTHSSAPSGFYVHADAEFIASLGHVDVTTAFVSYGEAETLVGALEEMGVDKGLIETALGIIDSGGSSSDDIGFPTLMMAGDINANTLIGAPNQNHIISAGPGNDFIVVYNGVDIVEGGYGSRDYIVKVGDVTEGTEIYGDEKVMTNEVADYDVILIRGEGFNGDLAHVPGDPGTSAGAGFGSVTMSGGAIYGDGHTLTDVILNTGSGGTHIVGENNEATLPSSGVAGDAITLVGNLTGGAIYGDAYAIIGSNPSTATGKDSITIEAGIGGGGVMSGGVVYGDCHTATSTGNEIYFGVDVIEVGTLTGSGAIYGDAHTSSSLNGSHGGNDDIYATIMSGGAIYGDFHTAISNGGAESDMGADLLNVGRMSGGSIYGDAYSVSGTHSGKTSGNAITVDIGGAHGGMTGGAIYGDAYSFSIHGSVSSKGDSITIGNATAGGNMSGGAIYGDAHTLEVKTTVLTNSFSDTITLNASMTGGTIYGDAHTINSVESTPAWGTNAGFVSNAFADAIKIGIKPGSSVSNAAIYGDAEYIEDVSINAPGSFNLSKFMSDTITINGDVTNTVIFGDARDINAISFTGNDSSSSFAKFMGDSIATHGTLGDRSVIYGDTVDGSVPTFSFTIMGEVRPIDNIGHDTISVGGLAGGKIFSGFGNDKVQADFVRSGAVNLGTGADTFTLGGIEDGSVLHLDFGGNGTGDGAADVLDISGMGGTSGDHAHVYLYNFKTGEGDSINHGGGWTGGPITDTADDTFTLSKGGIDITFHVMQGSMDAAVQV